MTKMKLLRNKRLLVAFSIAFVIGFVLFLNYFFSSTLTFGIVIVLEKDYSEENEEAWIIVVPPNTSDELEDEYKTKIFIEEPMVWNLIKEGQTYSVNYKTWHGESTLSYISHVMEENAIPREFQ